MYNTKAQQNDNSHKVQFIERKFSQYSDWVRATWSDIQFRLRQTFLSWPQRSDQLWRTAQQAVLPGVEGLFINFYVELVLNMDEV
jgi:hypothetical protein